MNLTARRVFRRSSKSESAGEMNFRSAAVTFTSSSLVGSLDGGRTRGRRWAPAGDLDRVDVGGKPGVPNHDLVPSNRELAQPELAHVVGR